MNAVHLGQTVRVFASAAPVGRVCGSGSALAPLAGVLSGGASGPGLSAQLAMDTLAVAVAPRLDGLVAPGRSCS